MKKKNNNPPSRERILRAVGGDVSALWEIEEHYDILMRYKLHSEVQKAAAEAGIEADAFSFEDLLCDMKFILLNAIGNFKL